MGYSLQFAWNLAMPDIATCSADTFGSCSALRMLL